MRITELLKDEGILLNADVKTQSEAIDVLVGLHEKSGNISDRDEYKAGVLKREEQGTTAIGEGIAIPHAKNKAVIKPGITAMTVPDGVDYKALDSKPTNLIFMIAAPEKGGDLHLEALSRLSVMLMNADFRQRLLESKTKEEFLTAIDEMEKEKYGSEEEPENKAGKEVKILAVTACPTGIAHTFMAAEALEEKGRELGIFLKAETNGSGGAKNVLTAKEIEEADGIIIAADKNVETARFNGKKVVFASVSDGIHKPQELIDKIIGGDAKIYNSGKEAAAAEDEKEGIGRQIYKHLMNGVSNMIPFVVAGGILIALSFLIDGLLVEKSVLEDPSQSQNFGTITPVAAWLKTIGGYAFQFMLPVLAGFIAKSIADRPGMMVGFVGGFLATTGTTFNVLDEGVASGFIGALIAGFAAGYIVYGLEKLCDHMPKSLEGLKPVLIYPLLGCALIAVFMCAVNPAVGWLNSALNDFLNSIGTGSKVVLGAVLGGMMSIDMGGPFNKAAYLFGTAGLAGATQGNYEVMAAVMIGGMVPPIACAIGTTFFKRKFTESERKSGIVNYVLGLCFISEGAIPFAAADPLRVIPSCIVGSAVAGGISMAFGCSLMAPHGGIFVFPVVGNWGWYLIALAIGSVIAGVIMSLLKRPVKEK